ncbi:L,D-transpeptidase family protein [Aurantiacibacter poecillastricola]|uniref:L,D-transpeptidase family protein n=1 Tax=Aurantiacibacter poecillastricola TaxID=3064385 RepID=UPI00273DB4E7|nr:L,D-transpeptidase family protein [Aurantiacibacter sp. 219JJ12-13]MDP5261217.1 L,D-transpeptidase family protein [Aurantiacibacter sp. 219JJ12-13]
MNRGITWTAGLALAIVALLGSAALFGRGTAAHAQVEEWLSAQDVLSGSTEVVNSAASDAVTFVTQEVVQETPPYDPEDPFVIKRVLPIKGPIRYGEWHWDEEGVPDGPLVMTVDLEARVISVFKGGYEIGAAAALLGTPDHPTPVGTFPILTKERHNVSEKYGNAPMPWTLRLTWDGVAVHGGSTVERGYASHGCIGVPDEFASRLFEIADVGDVVIVTDGVMTGVGGSLNTGG